MQFLKTWKVSEVRKTCSEHIELTNYLQMNIKILSCLSGAREAEGLTVVIDVFRASNTIISCFAQGAAYIIPVGELEKAYQFKREYPDHLLMGERGGVPPTGFDYGNSPAKAAMCNLKNKKIILTTSAGSQGIVNATHACEIVVGSFANAQALVDYINIKQPQNLSLLAMGLDAAVPAAEDEACARYIKALLNYESVDFNQMKNDILTSDGANRLINLNQTDDLEYALKLNICKIIPKYDFETGRLFSMVMSNLKQ